MVRDSERCAIHEQMIKGIREDTQFIRHVLTGNGDPAKGMIVRVDRLEQSERRRTWAIRAIVGSMIGSLIAFITGR